MSLALPLGGCGEDDTDELSPESCEAPELEQPTRFAKCPAGSGIFGRWTTDARGLVAYDYTLDQHADPRAGYLISEKDAEGEPQDRRNHWAAFGNRRVNAMFSNDGYVELVTQDRGVEYLNVFDADQGNFAGGFGYVDDGDAAWPTAYAWRPSKTETARRFGMGYAEAMLEHHDVRVTRRLASPPGYAPVVISSVTLENRSDETKSLAHYEYWDVGRRPIEINWLVSGELFSAAPESARQARDGRNALFEEAVRYEPSARRLFVERSYVGETPRPPPEQPSAIDYYPGSPFLVQLIGQPSDVYVDQQAFFGSGGVGTPESVAARRPGLGTEGGELSRRNGAGQPHLLVIKSELVLAPGQSKILRYAYGYARSGEDFEVEPRWRDPAYDPAAEYAEDLSPRLLYFASEQDPVLHRELAWHSYQIQASVGWRDYWQGPVVPQGSAYLYLHGADGAARDLGLFALPLVYTDPELARAELRLYAGMQYAADGRFSYAFQGHGMLDGATIHTAPSDLCLFFLWALGEYLGATGDFGFLDESAPFYPREARPDATIWSHLIAALRHQFDVIGTGEHGLIRIGTGDWSDGIVPKTGPLAELAVQKGESVPNTQMAVAILPRIADLIESRDAALAAEIRQHVEGYRAALPTTWTGEHFVRAYFGDGQPVHDDYVDLESQVWALIGDSFADPAQRETLIAKIASDLDDPSAIGATLSPGGDVWPAISGLLTWGYAKTDPERAWAHLVRNTLAAHAKTFPEVWYGIWSGPDGVSSKNGLAWSSQVTPMRDFPVQNNNQHALPLLAALRVAGIEASARGLVISPRVPSRRFSLVSRLVSLRQRADGTTTTLSGSYHPSGNRPRLLEVIARPGEQIVSAQVDTSPVPVAEGATSIELGPISGSASFEVTTSP